MIKKKSLYGLWLLFALGCAAGVSSQEREMREMNESFTGIRVGSGIDLFLTQGEPQGVEVEADKSLINKVTTSVTDGVLKVYLRNNLRWMRSRTIKVYVTIPEITMLEVSGGADLRGTGPIAVKGLAVKSSGGADVYLSVNGDDISLSASGGADIKVEGRCHSLVASAGGGADIEAANLKARIVKASASGGADVDVHASERIEAEASGGGDVTYHGSPAQKSVSESGGGDVTGR